MKVAVAVITNAKGQVLITRRPQHATHSGFWEYPGGKLELNETAEQALIREIKEEIALEVEHYHYLGEVNHRYSESQVSLQVFHVDQIAGEAQCCEGQMDLRWVEFSALGHYDFPAANEQIIVLIHEKILESVDTSLA